MRFFRLGVIDPLMPGELFLRVKLDDPDNDDHEYWLAYDPEKVPDPVGIFTALLPGDGEALLEFIGDGEALAAAGFRHVGLQSVPAVEVHGVWEDA